MSPSSQKFSEVNDYSLREIFSRIVNMMIYKYSIVYYVY